MLRPETKSWWAQKKAETLSPSAQLLILGKLYKKEWIKESPSKMSGKIGISNMSVGRAFSELELHNIASAKTSGKEIADPLSVYLEFRDSDDERIEEALEDLLKDIQW